jgi:hypothetical protein
MATHRAECFCGAVQIEVSGEPEVMGYCHCRSRRSWSGGPVNAFTLWKPEAVRITAGSDQIGMFQKTAVVRTERSRQLCRDRSANAGRSSEAQRFSSRVRRLARAASGVAIE